MPQVLLVACCFLACPLIMGAMMLWIGRDSQGRRLDRELRRMNAAADLRRAARDASVLQQDNPATSTPDLGRLQSAVEGHEWPALTAEREPDRTAEVPAGDVA